MVRNENIKVTWSTSGEQKSVEQFHSASTSEETRFAQLLRHENHLNFQKLWITSILFQRPFMEKNLADCIRDQWVVCHHGLYPYARMLQLPHNQTAKVAN